MTTDSITPKIDRVLAGYDRQRQNLIPILQDIQDQLGFLGEEAVNRIAEHLDLSPNEIFGVATFYTQFRFAPLGKNHLKVCRGTACHVRGSALILEKLEQKLGVTQGETTADGKFSIEKVACFGSCALAPVVVINDKVYGRMTAKKTEKIIEDLK